MNSEYYGLCIRKSRFLIWCTYMIPIYTAFGKQAVFISQKDKNPLVNGNGIKKLRNNGIRVTQTSFNDYINNFNKTN